MPATLDTTSSGGAVSDRLTIARPSVTAGQLLVAVIANRRFSTFNPVIVASSHAWTQEERYEPATAEVVFFLLTRVADATDEGVGNWTWDFTLPGTSGNPIGTVFVIDGADTSSPIEATTTAEGSSTAPSAGPVTVSTDDTLALFGVAARSTGSVGHTAPAGFTEAHDHDLEILFASSWGIVDTGPLTPTSTLASSLVWAAIVALIRSPGLGGWSIGTLSFR